MKALEHVRSLAWGRLSDTEGLGGAHRCQAPMRYTYASQPLRPAPGSARNPLGAIASFLSQFREHSFAPLTPAPGGLAPERWRCRPSMPAPREIMAQLDQQRHSARERLGRRKMVAVFVLVWQRGSASSGYFA